MGSIHPSESGNGLGFATGWVIDLFDNIIGRNAVSR
jgi:hypothetical protein